MSLFHDLVVGIKHWLTPHPWRVLFTGRAIIAVYLEGGGVMKIRAESFKWNRGNSDSYSAEGVLNDFNIMPSKIIATKIVRWF